MTKEYHTFVVEMSGWRGEMPKDVGGHRIVSWADGHSLAEMDPLLYFVQGLVDELFADLDDFPSPVVEAAREALEKSLRQREAGYDN